MTQNEVKMTLAANRDLVISFFNNECAENHPHYTLKWFMTQILERAEIGWARRRNISEKEIISMMTKMFNTYPSLKKGYVSNWQKAVNYFGYDKACAIARTR